MNTLAIGAGIAALVALGYAFFRYEHRCPTGAEIDKIVGDIKGNRLSLPDAEAIAKELDRRKCAFESDRVRGAIKGVNATFAADAAAKAATEAAAKAAADAKKPPTCDVVYSRLPDAPLRRAATPSGPPPFGVKSIRAFAIETSKLDGPTRAAHAKIIEDDGPYWAADGVAASVFSDASRCLQGLTPGAPLSFYSATTSATALAGFTDPRRRARA